MLDDLVERSWSAITAISATEIVIFGGKTSFGFFGGQRLNTGYVFDTDQEKVTSILGREGDLEFINKTQS